VAGGRALASSRSVTQPAADHLLVPWFDGLRDELPGLELLDVHTHIGANDPDGFTQTPEELLERLGVAGARAVVFPMHEPDGYPAANDAVLEAAAASPECLTAFCRVDPLIGDAAVEEAERALDAGARGIKLHPRAERFAMTAPAVSGLAALAAARRVAILIHAGRGIPALGRDTLTLAAAHPEARFILAHAGICDLAWLWRELPAHPNVFLDTAWWSPADLLAVFAYVPPGQVLFGSDSPYGTPVAGAVLVLRCALQAGLSAEQVLEIAAGQARRVIAGEDVLDLGPAPGVQPERFVLDPLLDRVGVNLTSAVARLVHGEESLALARLACAVGSESPHAESCAQVLELLERFDVHVARPEPARLRFSELGLLTAALALLRTPAVPLPRLADHPVPERGRIDA
jgi:predicted TIM-barrel fold metal-dependent hydrolase